jgi:hypothetical protein
MLLQHIASPRLPFAPSCGDVWSGYSHGRSSVDGHEARFVTNTALGEEAIVVPLGYDVKRGEGGALMEMPAIM